MDYLDRFQARLNELQSEKRERRLGTSQGLSFVHNDYLALSQHPKIVEAAVDGAKLFGAGSRGSRLLGGHGRVFEDLENAIADFFGSPEALFFSTGYMANLALVQTLAPFFDRVFSDERNHASLIDGMRLSKCSKQIVPQGGWCSVPHSSSQPSLWVTESLFSMDGVFAEDSLRESALENDRQFLIVDEAHAVGAFGETGQGHWVLEEKDYRSAARVVTFGKAFGVAGAAVLCSPELKKLLINEARTFIYTTAPSPAVCQAVRASLEVVREEGWRRAELWSRAEEVRQILARGCDETSLGGLSSDWPAVGLVSGVSAWDRRSPIVSFVLPGEGFAERAAKTLQEQGLDIRPIRYPTVPRGQERLRISLNLAVSRENTLWMAEALESLWTQSLLPELIQKLEKQPSPQVYSRPSTPTAL